MRVAERSPLITSLTPDECRGLLSTQQVGRIGFVLNGQPDVLPVNYVMDGDAVVFATSPGSKLMGTTRSTVAFEVDHVDVKSRSGWSVVIHAIAQEITDLDTSSVRQRLQSLPLSPWPGGMYHILVRIPTLTISGRRVGPPSA